VAHRWAPFVGRHTTTALHHLLFSVPADQQPAAIGDLVSFVRGSGCGRCDVVDGIHLALAWALDAMRERADAVGRRWPTRKADRSAAL